MTDLQFMPNRTVYFETLIRWCFSEAGSTRPTHTLIYHKRQRKFEADRIGSSTVGGGGGPISRIATVKELVALLPPEEVAKAVASSLLLSREE